MTKENKELNKSLNIIAKTSILVFAALFISKLLTYAYRIIIARFFGPEIYGIFSLAIIVLGLAVAISSLGLVEGIVRYIPIYRGKNQKKEITYLIKFISKIAIFSSLFSTVFLFMLSESISQVIFKGPALVPFLKVFSILIPIFVFSNIYLATLRGLEKIGWQVFILNILQNVIKLLALISLIYFGFGNDSITYSYFLGILVSLMVSYFVAKYFLSDFFSPKPLNNSSKKRIKKEVFSYSWPTMFSGVFIMLLFWVDSAVIGYFNGPVAVGLYNAAIPLIGLFSFSQEIFMQLFFPLMIREYSKKNLVIVNQLSKQIAKWIFILDLPLFFIIILFPTEIINLLFGQEYLLAKTTLQILAIGAIISFLSPLLQNILLMVGRSKLILMNIIIAAFANLILNIVLVQKYGLAGAAVSTAIISVSLFLVLFMEARKFTSITPLRRKMGKIFLISLIPFTLILFIKQFLIIDGIMLILLSLLFFFTYLLLIFLTKSLDQYDLEILATLKRRILKKD